MGSVRDASGAALPGATVSLSNSNTGVTTSTLTSADGHYELNVARGTYQLRVTFDGFAPYTADVVVNRTPVATDIVLSLAPYADTIVVTARAHPRRCVPRPWR
jgi:Carboxypeptidase regulatory-like domain